MVQNRYPANISNEELEEMELIEFEEEIIVVERMNRLYYQAIEELRNAKILGFDTERIRESLAFTHQVPLDFVKRYIHISRVWGKVCR